MAITEGGAGPSKEPTTTRNPDNTSSAQNGANQQLPGLAGFGQMQGYQPVGGQPQEPAPQPDMQTQPEPVPELIPAEPVVPHDPIPDQSFALDSQNDGGHLATEIDPFAPETDHPVPDYLAGGPAAGAPAAGSPATGAPATGDDSASLMDDIQSYMNEQSAFDDAQLQPGGEVFDAGALQQAEVADPAPYTGDGGALQTFEATYDQHPEVPLGAFEQPGEPHPQPGEPHPQMGESHPQLGEPQPQLVEPQPEEQPFLNQDSGQPQADADFLSGEAAPEAAAPKQRRGRKILMAASGLVGVLALGGALAFAYKIGGDSDIAKAGKPPLIQADSRPVKVVPAEPGGKQFPHANKKIYERLSGKEGEEVVKIKPRQEDIAAAATAAVGPAGPAQASPQNATPPGAPRKVKTLTVRPDGTIEMAAPQAPAAAPPGTVAASDGTVTMRFPTPASAPGQAPAATPPGATAQPVAPAIPAPPAQATPAPQQQAAVAPPAAVSPPVQKPRAPSAAPRQAAAQPAAASGAGNYVVQVAARKSQTDALAAFADIQQKYPRLLSGYRPIIQRADLGNKGVWYRLNVGPVESKKVASSLCGQLKGAGMRSCIVRSQ